MGSGASPNINQRPRQRSACSFLSRAVVSADVRRRASTIRRIASRAHLGVGEGADRRRWRMQGSGRRENNEQTRGHLCRRSMRRLFFRLAEAASQSAGLLVLLVTKVHIWNDAIIAYPQKAIYITFWFCEFSASFHTFCQGSSGKQGMRQ